MAITTVTKILYQPSGFEPQYIKGQLYIEINSASNVMITLMNWKEQPLFLRMTGVTSEFHYFGGAYSLKNEYIVQALNGSWIIELQSAIPSYFSDGRSTCEINVPNTAPTAPTGFTSPTPFRSERNNVLSWTGGADIDGNLAGYKVRRSIDLGNSWTQIYQGPAATTTDRLDYNQAVNVQYSVCSYDTQGAESAWYTSVLIPVVNNRPPTAPPNINVPLVIYSGEPVTTTWSASTDPENNLSGYTFERSVNGGTWEIVTNINALTYVDTAGTDWSTVTYRVKARDTYGDESSYTTSPTRTVESNKAPVITCEITKLGIVKADITVPYSVSDPDGDTVTVSEYIDSTLIRSYTAVDSANQTLSLTGMSFMKVLNGSHSLKITATDSKGKSSTHTITLTKQVYEAVVLLTPAQSLETTLGVPITLAIMSIVASFGDSEVEILATNNAKDTSPVWEDATTAFLAGNNYVFKNTTIAKGNNYAFKITARRPSGGGTGGHMSYIGGAFE